MDPVTLRRLSDIRHQEMLDSVLRDRTDLAKGNRHMDMLIIGAALAHIHLKEQRENALDNDLREPKPSWLQRFGRSVLARLGGRRPLSADSAQIDATDTGVPCMRVEG